MLIKAGKTSVGSVFNARYNTGQLMPVTTEISVDRLVSFSWPKTNLQGFL